jgi:hypothetical protein
MGYIMTVEDMWEHVVEYAETNRYIKMFDDDLQRTSDAMTEGAYQGIYEVGDLVKITVSDEQLDEMRKYITKKRPYRDRPALIINKYLHPHVGEGLVIRGGHGVYDPSKRHINRHKDKIYYTVAVGKDKIRVPEHYLSRI